ncbi:MAG: flavodoxin domain-containing protein [Tissierellia bacterium]|nr:flavodoxin domain-containing protein [Tissierellia bacterium]
MKANLIYFSSTGHTEAMADVVKEALEEKGYDVEVYTDEQGSEFADADLLVFGSPACGTEEVDESIIVPTIDSIDDFADKKVFLFGSYGWGGGEYMETWRSEMEGKGAIMAAEPVVCLEEPDDSVVQELKDAIASI